MDSSRFQMSLDADQSPGQNGPDPSRRTANAPLGRDELDLADHDAIIDFARGMEGLSLRRFLQAQGTPDVSDALLDNVRNKGAFGALMEQAVFGLQPNSSSAPDFAAAGLELKTTPLKRVRNGLSAKERLVLGMIDYHQVVDETFENSHLMDKARDMLLVSYLWDAESETLDWPVALVEELKLDQLPPQDLAQIRTDWETIVAKVRAGHAHEISGSDTYYLEACPKGANASQRRSQPFSDEPAKPRAWALKASYMTALSQQWIADRVAHGQEMPGIDAAAWAAGPGAQAMQAIARRDEERNLDLLTLVRGRFAPFFGMTEGQLGERFGYCTSRQGRPPKNLCALVTRAILGVDENARIAEFEKAGIQPKTIRLRRNGKPKEALSFPAFDYFELTRTPFEESAFARQLEQRFLFVLYREDEQQRGTYRLSDVMFWQMPDADLGEAARCYEKMRQRVANGRADESVKTTENRCCHVRPHARDSHDTLPAPGGRHEVKKSFWLNIDYLAEQIAGCET